MRVLIADDDPAALLLLENVLGYWGYEAVTAGDGTAAWDVLRRPDTPRLAVLDWIMPGLDGDEICRRVRRSPDAPYIYLIMLTGRAGRPDIVRGLEAGADDYLAKPFDIEELEVRLRAGRRIIELNEALGAQAAELARSNRDLEQFAYVASHDLQEPLRMVSSYTQLLARRYKGRLDADADAFIGFAVDGAARMQRLINDLLAYSRVGNRGREFGPTDCGAAFDQALVDLKAAIEESGAVVTCDPLPTVRGDSTQIGQLLQNLIGNAVKYRGEAPPRVHVSAVREGTEWVFSVRDNGIGIDPKYAERIFVIFQRLHTREQYSGTGIGLAICKKIVERHGGRIWVESQPGGGATFCFTIPDAEGGR
jgi:light-regulated signal transduction histidine kinase (bacteriophytochrome)